MEAVSFFLSSWERLVRIYLRLEYWCLTALSIIAILCPAVLSKVYLRC